MHKSTKHDDCSCYALWDADLNIELNRAVDKREYLVIIRDKFCQFYIKTYVVTPHLNRLFKTVQMRGHIIWFR